MTAGQAAQSGGETRAPHGPGPWLVIDPDHLYEIFAAHKAEHAEHWRSKGCEIVSLPRALAADAMVQAMRDAKLQIEQGAEGFAIDTLHAGLRQAGEQP